MSGISLFDASRFESSPGANSLLWARFIISLVGEAEFLCELEPS